MSLLDKLGVKKEAAAFWAAVQYGEQAIPEDKKQEIVHAGEALGWAIAWRVLLKLGVPAGFLLTVGLTILGSQATGTAPPGIVQPTAIAVVAAERGTAYDVAAFCNDPSTKVIATVMTDAPNGGTRYLASRGIEQVNWADSPPGKNDNATHYYPNAQGVQQSEAVQVTKSAADCFKKKVQ